MKVEIKRKYPLVDHLRLEMIIHLWSNMKKEEDKAELEFKKRRRLQILLEKDI